MPNVPQLIKVSLLQAPPPKQKIKQRKGDFSASEDHEQCAPAGARPGEAAARVARGLTKRRRPAWRTAQDQ